MLPKYRNAKDGLRSKVSIFRMTHVKYVQKSIFSRKIYVRSKLSCVRSSHDLCARTLVHGLEGLLFSLLVWPMASGVISYVAQRCQKGWTALINTIAEIGLFNMLCDLAYLNIHQHQVSNSVNLIQISRHAKSPIVNVQLQSNTVFC